MIPYAGFSFYAFEYFKYFCMKYAPKYFCNDCSRNTGELRLIFNIFDIKKQLTTHVLANTHFFCVKQDIYYNNCTKMAIFPI